MDPNLIPLAKALADDTRVRLVGALGGGGELSCGELVERCQVGQSTVSHHLKTLVESGLVEVRQAGQRSLYRLRDEVLRGLAASLTDLVGRPAYRPAVRPDHGLPDLGGGVVD